MIARGDGATGSAVRSAETADQERPTFRLFTEGDELYEAMLASIAEARESIRLETFIFAADAVGWQFAEALAGKAREGVDVRFQFDARGSATGASPELYAYLTDAGVKLKWFHEWSWWHPYRYFQRNHRKLLIIDERELFLGGANICAENSRAQFGDNRQRDTHVFVASELAKQASLLFDHTWEHPDVRHKQARARRIPEFSGIYHGRMSTLYALAMRRASRRLYITSPYFSPGSPVERAMRRAARRGVDVRLLVPRNSDPPFVGWMTRSAYSSLMRAGIRVYEYLPGRKLHAKTIAIDDEWSMIGSANLDHLSLTINHELVLVARDRSLANELQRAFIADLERSEEVQPAQWAKRGRGAIMLEMIGWTARKLL
jgi:cardiolipin synthase